MAGPIWGVLVVHGVGDTGPGVTLEAILPTLRQTTRGGLTEIAQPETRLLPEPKPELPPKQPVPPPTAQATSGVPLGSRFPVHLRRFRVETPQSGDPAQAAFAEVFWADLSTAGEGTLRLLLRLFTAIFDLRYIPYVAAACPDVYTARWLRLVLYGISWLLCGPIAALTAVMMYMLAARFAAAKASSLFGVAVATAPGPRGVFVLASIGLVLGIGLWVLRRARKWRGHWAFVTGWIVFAAAGNVVLAFAWAKPFSNHLAALRDVLQLVFVVLGVLTVIAFLAWIVARIEARIRRRHRARPALDAALTATVLQVALWVLVVPALGAVPLRQWAPELVSGKDDLFAKVLTGFVQNLAFAGLVVACAAAVWLWRAAWVRSHRSADRGIPRLLVNDVLVYIILGVCLAGSVATVYAVITDTERLGGLFSEHRYRAVLVVLAIITVISALFQKGLRNALHILMDVVSHFSRERLPVPRFADVTANTNPAGFMIQQRLEARFRSALEEVLQLGDVTHLTVVAHSQGTMIAIDVLWLEWAARRLAGKEVYLVTMGSPFTHLYQHYFPHRYPPLFSPGGSSEDWGTDLRRTVRSWLNVYRVDDFVGTYVDGDDTSAFPINTSLAAGGHTGYWRQREALEAMRPYLPGR